MISPGSPATFSTFSLSSAATRYCLPPVLMTANIFSLVFVSRGSRRPESHLARLLVQSDCSEVFTRLKRQKHKRTGPKARLARRLWRGGAGLSRNRDRQMHVVRPGEEASHVRYRHCPGTGKAR